MGRPQLLKPKNGIPGLRVDPKGRYWAILKVNGEPVQKLVGPRKLAEQFITKVKEEARVGKLFPEQAKALGQNAHTLADIFARYRTVDENKNTDSHNHERMEAVWVKELGADRLWHDVSIEDIGAQQAKWLREGMAPGTINRYTTRLHAVLALAVKDRAIRYNPVSGYTRLREPASRNRKMELEEEARLRPHCEDWVWDMYLFAVWTGFREEEQFRCKLSYVDLVANEIRLPEVKTTKRQSPGRTIPILPEVRDVVERLVARAKELRTPWLFPNFSASNHWLPGNFLRRWWKPALEKAGIRDLYWHDLRRTCATRLHVILGWPMAAVQAYLGHGNSRTTDRYMAVASAQLHELANRPR